MQRLIRSIFSPFLGLCAILGLSAAASSPAEAQFYDITDLASFNVTNGLGPGSGLLVDSQGNFYGYAGGGGANSAGVIFKVYTVPAPDSLIVFASGGLSAVGMLLRKRRKRDWQQ